MEIILLGIYASFVWLIFIKFKLLPWTTPWKVAVAIFPVVALGTMLLLLNVFAPTTTDVRVVKYVVPIVSQVKGRVIEVPVENNRPVKKGDVLFRIDPTPYQSEVRSLEARLVSDEAKVGAERARLSEMQTRLPDAQSGERQLLEQLNQATNQVASLQASLDLARKRVAQNTELAAAGAGNRFDLEQAQTNVTELTSQIAAARAVEQQVREKLSGRINGDLAPVAGAKAQISTALAAGAGRPGAGGDDARPAGQRPLESGPDDHGRAGRRHDGERDAPAGLFRHRRGVQRSDDVRRYGVPDLRAVQPERAAPGRAGERSGDHARHVPGPHHQGARGLGDLGAGAGAGGRVRQSPTDDLRLTTRPVPGEARCGRARQ